MVGFARLGEIEPFLPEDLRMNIPMLDPADFGVVSIEAIQVAVGIYRGPSGDAEATVPTELPAAPGIPGIAGPLVLSPDDVVLLVESISGGARSTSVILAETIDGLAEALQPA